MCCWNLSWYSPSGSPSFHNPTSPAAFHERWHLLVGGFVGMSEFHGMADLVPWGGLAREELMALPFR